MALFKEFGQQEQLWTVEEITAYIRDMFEIDYRLRDISVRGEISNVTLARSGHLYFTLKDERAQLKCVMWKAAVLSLAHTPKEGDSIIARGNITVYEAGGQYQLYVEHLEPAGRGTLAEAFERLKRQLAEEGLFDQEYKKPLPAFPRKIGLVTSANAAAFRDIRNVLDRRWPIVSVLLAPTLVQGSDAPPQIVRAIQRLDQQDDVDIIIVARGGGSIEDLWAFNEEAVARAIFSARHPIIVGVGHETDFTIADFVADLRAPTPSAAAELAVPDSADIAMRLSTFKSALSSRMSSELKQKQFILSGLIKSLAYVSPARSLINYRQRLDYLTSKLDGAIGIIVNERRMALKSNVGRLQAMSPKSTLERGYSIVRDDEGVIIKGTKQVSPGKHLSVQVSDGTFGVAVDKAS